ncbi:hypothetical protein K438DRAFT_1755539 [Mycena galopus ATCC 62051]|nr:hypothetical protein K438DRAFT_1755539 [Mycena galopus ATCC 62051]
MPRRPTVTEMRLDNITVCLTQALPLLTELNDAFGPPFVQSIVNTIQALINLVQNVKQNKTECARVMENIHQIVYAIINLHIKSETVGSLSPSMLDYVGKFMETLHKIYTFIEAQQEGNKIKHLFGNKETKKLLQDCCAGLTQAMDVFGIQRGVETLNDVREFKDTANLMHKELVKLIETLSDTSTLSSERSSIFHGREQELENVLKLLSQKSPRIAILGGGGMGKTSLARAALHHADTASKFQHRFFVSAEAATTSIELAALVGLHLGLNPGPDLTKAVVQYFSRKPSSLLILDNLETVWEPIWARVGVENLLSLLSEVENLALMPLSDEAAKQTFMDITDNSYTFKEINQLLQFTDNMPLAVDLIAHLTDYEGLPNVLLRWEIEKTSMLSVGFDRQSSLDASIHLSLSSPRITSDSKQLLSLLSVLPNGLSEVELVQSKLGILNILCCKAALQATSLVYEDSKKRLLVLMPIREYIQQILPPAQPRIKAIHEYFCALLELYKKYEGEQLHSVVNQITMNLANLHGVLKRGLHDSDPNLVETIYCILSLNCFYRITGRNSTPLIDNIPSPLPWLSDPKLEIALLIEHLKNAYYHLSVSQEAITQAISHFHHIHDPGLESQLYEAAGLHAIHWNKDAHQATEFLQKALESSRLCEDSYRRCAVLLTIGWVKCASGDHHAGQVHANAVQKHSKLSANLYQEAIATQLGAACARQQGEYQESLAQLFRARELLKICGLSGGYLDHNITLNQAEIHLLKSEYTEAQKMLREVVETTSAEENALSYGFALLSIAQITMMTGKSTEGVCRNLDIVREALSDQMYQFISTTWGILQANMELIEGKFDSASVKFQKCFLLAQVTDCEAGSFCLDQLANIRAWPASDWQYKQPMIYLGHAYKTKYKLGLHKALLFLGDVFIVNEDEETAISLYQAALTGFTYMDIHQSRAQCMLRLGDLENKNGCTSEAIILWKEARPLFERSSQAKNMAQIDLRLVTVGRVHQKTLTQLETLHADAPVQMVNEDDDKDSDQVPVLV